MPFLKTILTVSIFIWTVASDKGDRLWDVKLTPWPELYDGEQWIAFCPHNMAVAHVACRQQGYTNATSFGKDWIAIANLYFPIKVTSCPTVSNYFLYGETNIMHCNISLVTRCSTTGIFCNTDTIKETDPYNGQIYLDKTGTDSPADGVVEVYLNKHWYRVCSNNFTDIVADSICRQYGYTGHDTWTTVEPASSVDSVLVSEYTCTDETGSFECFSHCISNYSIVSCDDHVAVTCSFDIYAEYITSGSRSQCALDDCSHCSVDECSHFESSLQTYRIITGALSSLLLFIVLIMAFWFCRKKKFFGCCRKYDDLDLVRYEVDGRRNDQ